MLISQSFTLWTQLVVLKLFIWNPFYFVAMKQLYNYICHQKFYRLSGKTSTSAISTARLRIGQKISTFCAPPLRLAFVKYQFSKYGYFMIYCKKEIIHLWSDLKVKILSFLLILPRGNGPTRGLVVTKRGGKAKGAAMMIFFPPSGNITRSY